MGGGRRRLSSMEMGCRIEKKCWCVKIKQSPVYSSHHLKVIEYECVERTAIFLS